MLNHTSFRFLDIGRGTPPEYLATICDNMDRSAVVTPPARH
jgi:hypothetical protein